MVPQAVIGVKDLIGFEVKSGCGNGEGFLHYARRIFAGCEKRAWEYEAPRLKWLKRYR